MGLLNASFCGCAGPYLLVGVNGARVSVAGVPEEFPGRNVFLVANPNVKVGINPGSGKNPRSRRNFSSAGDGFTCRERAEVRVGFDAAVKFAQEFAAVAWVIFPGVFAIEKKANGERLAV